MCVRMYNTVLQCGSLSQLMCDEYEQKLDRLETLNKKVEELKLKQGEFNLSGMHFTCTHYYYAASNSCKYL